MIVTVEEAARILATNLHPKLGDSDNDLLLFGACGLEFEERIERGILTGKVRARSKLTGAYDVGQAFLGNQALVEFDDVITFLEGEGMPIDYARTSGAPESDTPPEFRPRIGWQIALFEAWPDICKLYARTPSAAEAVRYLQTKDQSGVILPKTDGGSLWWNPQRGTAKEITLKTVGNTISRWKTRGVLPA